MIKRIHDEIKLMKFVDLGLNSGKNKKIIHLIPFAQTIITRCCAKKAMALLDESEAHGFSSTNQATSVEMANQATSVEMANKLKLLSKKMKKSYFIEKKLRLSLDQRIIALSARTGISSQKVLKKPLALTISLKIAGEEYKKNTYSIDDEQKVWNTDDDKVLNELIRKHPNFARHLQKNEKLQNRFFEWTLLHKYPSDLFVKYVTVTERIPSIVLSHMATACPGALEETEQNGYKKLTIACSVFSGNDNGSTKIEKFNALDPSTKVPFSKTHVTTIKDVFKEFSTASSADREMQFFKEGLHHWNTGAYQGTHVHQRVDFTEKNWWEQLPVFKTLTLEEAQARYHEKINGTNWVMSPRGAHQSDELVAANNHAYLEVAIPNEDGTSYNIYPFGRDPAQDPFGLLQTLDFLGKTDFGRVIYADQGAYYTDRRNTGITIALTEEKGTALMESIRHDIVQGLDGKISFQLTWENCAKWVQDKIDCVMPEDSAPKPFQIKTKEMKGILYKKSLWVSQIILTLFGVHRQHKINGKNENVSETPFYREGISHHPARIVDFRNKYYEP